jgi:CDGSH-type Zn-finger protein/truncated hemoglobin YjbI
MDLADADGLAAVGRATPALSERDIVPRGQDFATVGHLYRSIEAEFARLADKRGEDWLFVGPPRAQATAEYFRWPELVAVTDLASARRAIEEILEQGEGARGDWRDAHFGQFVEILDEYQQMREARPGFDPVRPVIAANVRPPERDIEVPLITDPLTARIIDLFNVSYEILLQIFQRYFAHTEETDVQLKALADATVGLMVRVIKPLGDLITALPAGPRYEGQTAGPSFELFYESDYLLPHREAAWALLAERLEEAAWLCDQLVFGRGRRIAGQLEPILAAMRGISRTLAAHLPARSPHARLAAAPPTQPDPAELDALPGRARDKAASVAARVQAEAAGELAEVFQTVHAIVESAAAGLGCGQDDQVLIVRRLVDSVLRPLADALAKSSTSPDGPTANWETPGKADFAGIVNSPGLPGATAGTGTLGQAGTTAAAGRVWEAAKAATVLRVRLGRAGLCPPELAEATAALQDLACRLVLPDEAAARRDQLWGLQSGLPATIQAERNGPHLVTNVPRLLDHLGAGSRPAPQLALCRCGALSVKPLCDGSCASSGFTDLKGPKRVPDRRDTYHGQQLTILDNRGICQHSGFCTDRLAAAFRAGTEPFVAPSGGRADEIIRAVRDCPSGALSYAIDGIEARGQVDWNGTRQPAIEVTKDGPYRVTGRIALIGADGTPEPRSQGASLEHYALCRCGHSQNKPFCSGMHWYVGFRDPVPEPGDEPTLFEWAGGLPALTRMTRLLYERHVAADPLLASLFADMPPDQPQRLATWIGGALGGPTHSGDAQRAVGFPPAEVGDDQRSRWLALITKAADEAGLPADPSFRSAFASCSEWLSRAATRPPQQEADASGQPPAPIWDWGPAGPPPIETDTAEAATPAAPLPAPGEPVSFAAHIKPLFRQRDRQSMSFAFDLWSYGEVRTRAADILARLRDGSMPCDGAWPAAKLEIFQRWIDTGTQS